MQTNCWLLANRRAILALAHESMRQARRRSEPLSVLIVDVDHFKQINDGHGHGVGDQVLRQLAAVLPASLRSRDRLGRIGGEEFLAVLPGASLEQALAIAERMRQSVAAAAVEGDAGLIAVTVSIGVAANGPAAEPVDRLVERADSALYRAKSQGRNAVAAAEADDNSTAGRPRTR